VKNKLIISNREFDFEIGCKILKLKYQNQPCPIDYLNDFWNDIQPATFSDIALIQNVESRRIAFSLLGTDNLLKHIDLILVDKQDINRKNKWKVGDEYIHYHTIETYYLYALSSEAIEKLGLASWLQYNIKILKFKDTSTDREYILWTNTHSNDAIAAIADSFKIRAKHGNIEKIIRQGDCLLVKLIEPEQFTFERSLTKEEYINLVVNES